MAVCDVTLHAGEEVAAVSGRGEGAGRRGFRGQPISSQGAHRHGSGCGTRGKRTSVLEVGSRSSPHTPSARYRGHGPGLRMLKMKLPQRKTKHRASDEDGEGERLGMCSRPCSLRECPATNGAPGPDPLQREAVYEWFVRTLGPAQRLEFACGLLDLCNPLELRFLGSCLEDLARKDCHYLRDYESRANSLAGELLVDPRDPVIRSRLIVYLALLSSENREVAGRLYRLLPTMETLAGWERGDEEREPGEELLLLLTMASLHPAFSFHQRVTLRERLEGLREALEKNVHEYLPNSDGQVLDGTIGTHNGVGVTAHSLQQEAVHIEHINIKHVQRRRVDKNSDYTFEVNWSDNSRTSVTKSYGELLEFLLMLPKELSNENLDKTILEALQLGKHREEPPYCDLEPIVKQIFSSPSKAILQNQKVYNFFQNIHTGPTHSGHLQLCAKYCKSQEDSSETSSQEEDIMHHTSLHKKPAGKCLVTNYIATKASPCEVTNVPHGEQNGKDWSRENCTSDRLIIGHQQRPLDKQNFHPVGRETSDGNAQKVNGRLLFKANGVTPSHNLRLLTGKDPTLEVGSGHETCGETSSESYSSPPSPCHNRRESFESEEEKDRDTDSNSEDSTKHIFTTFGAVKASTAKLSEHLNSEDSTTETVNNSKFSHFHILPTLHCVMPSGADKLEHGLPPSMPSDGKTLGMLVSPVSMSPVREVFHQNSPAIVTPPAANVLGESEKCVDLLPSPLPVPTTFLPRNCQPSSSALHIPVHRMKLPPQGPTENCTVNGSTQTNMGIGTANAGFMSVHSPSGFTASPVTASDPLIKPISQIASLNQIAPHLDGNAGAMPATANLKLILPGANLSTAPSAVPFPLSASALASGMAPPPNNVLNASAAVAMTQPASGSIGQLQSVPPTVPTHSPGPAPSSSPALTHSTAQSDSTSFISAAVGNTSTNGAHLPPQQIGQGACGSCGRRCGCGNSGGIPFGNFYFPNPITGQMYTRVSPLFIPSLCNNTYLSQAHQSNGTQFPVFLHHQAPPYPNGLIHDPVLGGQANYGMQQMANFPRLYPMYPATNVVGNANGSVTKKNGNISCYNCGVNGHYAQDCKQPPMEANQQGTFRLRYLPNPSNDSLDSAD
ncbi:zinc finger CCHC domain-containing protein 2 isoform X2 [Hyla sarda]|uniref:zinc finger CCHC domain-containing protein 2 isoform X2 n=1 Tax=Hyla sarda TaxID=327740 RepID=UPI0024C3D2AC|nr:zinc finger CCHC domain-containing protein 2 isoform X2 [Hyla sarda]